MYIRVTDDERHLLEKFRRQSTWKTEEDVKEKEGMEERLRSTEKVEQISEKNNI